MKEYIEREALKRILIDKYNFFPAFVKNAIEEAPIADVAEVKHGEWLPSRNGVNPIRCNRCNMPALFVQEQDGFGSFGFYRCQSNYCPNCGANMDGERRVE